MKKLTNLILLTTLALAAGSCEKDKPIVNPPVNPPDVTPTPPEPSVPTVDYDKANLKDLAAKAGIKLGVSFTYWEYRNNSAVAGILKRDFAAVTFGNEMKQDAILQSTGRYQFSTADEMVGWARDCGTELFGHTLGWHSQQQRAYLNGIISKASQNNAASLLQTNWNLEKGTLDGFTASGFEAITSLYDVFAGNYAAKANIDGATLQFDVAIETGKTYVVSFWAKTIANSLAESNIMVTTGDGQEAGSVVTAEWNKYSVPFTTESLGEFSYRLTASKDVIIDNIRVIEDTGGGDQPSGGSYIDPNAIEGGIDFENFTAGSSEQLLSSGYFVQINGTDYVTVTDAFAHSGKLSLKMDNADGHASNSWDVQVVTKSFPVTTGKTYRVAWYGRASRAADLMVDIRGDGETQYRHSAYGHFPSVDTDWTYQSFDYKVEQGTELSFAFFGATEDVTYYIDDIQVFPVASAAGAPALRSSTSFKTSTKLDGELVNDAIGFVYRDWVYTMVEHFDVYGWDVVNETFSDWPVDFRNTQNTSGDVFVWGQYFKSTKDWVDKAFAYATDALARTGKTAILYLNDYNLETIDAKRKAYCDYVKGNPQVTGVGSQMHLDMSTADLENKIVASLTDLTATGRMVRISELDIKCTDLDKQAALYKFIFQKYLEIVPEAQRGGITIWGINDKDSWVGESSAPLLYRGQGYNRKPAYEALYVYLCELANVNPYKE